MTDKCLECNKDADWMRCTQFAGDHPYCDEHARLESDFDDMDDSYAYWVRCAPGAKESINHAADNLAKQIDQQILDQILRKATIRSGKVIDKGRLK
jgi:hypothetical protein